MDTVAPLPTSASERLQALSALPTEKLNASQPSPQDLLGLLAASRDGGLGRWVLLQPAGPPPESSDASSEAAGEPAV